MTTPDTITIHCQICGYHHELERDRQRMREDSGASYVDYVGECDLSGEVLEYRQQIALRPGQIAAQERKARWISEGTWRGGRSGVL